MKARHAALSAFALAFGATQPALAKPQWKVEIVITAALP